jgi:hypothetical protein
MALLDKLENLWLSYNRLPKISEELVKYCEGLKETVNIFLCNPHLTQMTTRSKTNSPRTSREKTESPRLRRR